MLTRVQQACRATDIGSGLGCSAMDMPEDQRMNAREARIKSTFVRLMTRRVFLYFRCAEFCDSFANRCQFFSFRASFETSLGAFRALLPSMGAGPP